MARAPFSRAVSLALAAWAPIGVCSSVQAQTLALDDEPRSGVLTADIENEVPAAAEHPRGTYAGVKAGGNEKPPVPATPNATPAVVTFPGFQMRPDGGSRLFVQLTSPVTTTVQVQGKLLLIDLGNARIGGATNRFALYTRYFNTPVVRAQLVQKDGRTKLELEMRMQINPRLSSENAQSGFHFVYVDFPPGSYLIPTAQPAPAAAFAPGTPQAPPAPPEPGPPQHLDELPKKANAGGSVQLDTSMDGELPPGMGATRSGGQTGTKSKAKAKGSLKL